MRKRDGRSLDHKALEDIRIQAVQRVEAGEAPSAVMRVMGFARTVIYDWLNKYRAGGIEALRALPIPGRPPKLTEQQRAWVYRTVTQNNPLQLQFEFALWTRAMVRDLIRQNCGVTLSLASVGRLLRSLGLTPQRPVRRAIEQVPAKVREWLTVDYPAIQAKARNSLWRKSRIRPGPGAVEFRTLNGMAMGKRPAARQASPMWVDTADLPTNDGHPYFERLNRVLADSGFDAFVEELCAAFYADRLGRPSLRPGRYFRMLFIGYFEGLTPLYVKNARGSTTARSVRGELKALASLGSRSPRTVNHGRQPAARVLRCAPALRVTAAADRAGSPCGPAGRLALDPLPGSATPASHSVVAENRRQTPEWDRVHLPDRGFAVARTIRKHAVGILAYLDTRMTERARGRTHPARPTG